MDATKDRRRSPRLYVTLPTTYQVLPAKVLDIPQKLAEVYERVLPNPENAGETLQGMVRDLSANGAFITGPTVPLLSRVLITFPLPGMANIEAIGWVLWRRSDDCTVEKMMEGQSEPVPVTLKKGFGILFEAIPSPARRHIHRLARMNTATTKLRSIHLFGTPEEVTDLLDDDIEEVGDLGGAGEKKADEVVEGVNDDTGKIEIMNVGEQGKDGEDVKAESEGTEDVEELEELEELEEIEEIEEVEEDRDSKQVSGEIGAGNENAEKPRDG